MRQKLAADFDKERVERFRKNLGAEELRDLALAIKAEDTPQVRKALEDARGILGREVWGGKAEDKEHGMRVIAEVEKNLASATPGSASPIRGTKSAADLRDRIRKMVTIIFLYY